MLPVAQPNPDELALAALAARRLVERRNISTQAFAEKYRHFRTGTPWFHSLWYAAFDDPLLTRLYVMGPREHAKTSCVLTYVTKRLAEDQRIRVGIVSGTDELATKFLGEVKHEFESNEDLIRDYGKLVGPRWTSHELVMRDARKLGLPGKDVSLFSIGRNGQISSRHCDILIVDDVESADTVKSELVRQATREWWSREVLPVLSKDGKFIVVGTRKHFDDLYSYLMTPESGWVVLDAAKSVWREDGSPIWPEFWDRTSLIARKAELDAQDVLAWPQEYLNTPLPSATQMFYPDRWPTYGKTPKDLTIIQFWDLAISEKQTADWTVGWTVGINEANDVFLLERRRGHWDFNTTLAQIAAMGQGWPMVTTVGIEMVAYQAAAVQEALRRTMLPIVPVVPDKDKVVRARLLEARAAAGKVIRPATCDWWTSFAPEAAYFPLASHDDQIDALAGAIRLAGWDASSTSWMYGVWTCKTCKHMFVFEPLRPCPKCGTKCPTEFENPELLAYGGRLNPAEIDEVEVEAV